jgi:hypothetical protein
MVHVACVRGCSGAYLGGIRRDKHSCLVLSNGSHELYTDKEKFVHLVLRL